MTEDFASQYGPWALVAGASDGVGATFARAVAERGVNVVLLARRQPLLDEVADGIRADFGVEARAVAVDLATPDAVANVLAAVVGLEVGTLMYNAGADPRYQPFLEAPLAAATAMVERNCTVPMQLCHHLAGPMVERGRGGIVIVSSGAALVGAANMVAYSASKAFDVVMAEALWCELHPAGVDVLGLVLGMTDTPALRDLLVARGVLGSVDDEITLANVATAEEVVHEALTNLDNGPTWFVSEELREGSKGLGSLARNDAVRIMAELGGLPSGNQGSTVRLSRSRC
jgi:short-subunit dehydrogenase